MPRTIHCEQNEKLAQLVWTAAIIGLFLVPGIIWTVAILLTVTDKSHAVVPGYEQQSLNWDDEVVLRNASKRLQWNILIDVQPASGVRNEHPVTLRLTDAHGESVHGASLQLTAFHRACAGDPQFPEFTETGRGVYTGKIRMDKSGIWQINGTATRNNDVLLVKEQVILKAR